MTIFALIYAVIMVFYICFAVILILNRIDKAVEEIKEELRKL